MDWGCGWQCGKGRDVGLNQIAAFEGKVASGNGEQSLSRDIYRLGQLFDFFRMCSFFFTSVGYYFTTMVGDLCPELLQCFYISCRISCILQACNRIQVVQTYHVGYCMLSALCLYFLSGSSLS